jgi:hypothetical protein
MNDIGVINKSVADDGYQQAQNGGKHVKSVSLSGHCHYQDGPNGCPDGRTCTVSLSGTLQGDSAVATVCTSRNAKGRAYMVSCLLDRLDIERTGASGMPSLQIANMAMLWTMRS